MQIYKSADGSVIKCVHEDLSETTIKLNSTCDGQVVQSNKATVFISVSYGCNQGCKMCYLTIKKCRYKPLKAGEIFDNVVDSIEENKDVLKDKYIKLSFMGMGDVSLLDPVDFISLVRELSLYVIEDSGSLGLHSVDIGTSLPKVIDLNSFTTSLKLLSDYLSDKAYIKDRYPVRLFISLHSISKSTRKYLLPNSYSIGIIDSLLDDWDLRNSIEIVLHYTLIDNINNLESDTSTLISWMRSNIELRLLRYNSCGGTDLKEPSEESYKYFIDSFSNQSFKFKYQISTGSELKAACGQFLLKEIV